MKYLFCHRNKVGQKECKGWRIPEISNVVLTGSLALRRILRGLWKVAEGPEEVWCLLEGSYWSCVVQQVPKIMGFERVQCVNVALIIETDLDFQIIEASMSFWTEKILNIGLDHTSFWNIIFHKKYLKCIGSQTPDNQNF